MHVPVTRRIAVALALARVLGRQRPIPNLGSGSRNALDMNSRRPLARGLLLLGGRGLLGLLAACTVAHLGWGKGRAGR